MPVVISPLKEVLNEKLKEASDLFRMNPEDKIALRYVNAIHDIIAVCENRNRY